MACELAEALRQTPDVEARFVVSTRMENLELLKRTGAVDAIQTFDGVGGALAGAAFQGANIRAALRGVIRAWRPEAVIELMPHVWSPLLEGLFREERVRRVAILHDAAAHPGDVTGFVTGWLKASALRGDRIITLSRFVADCLIKESPTVGSRIQPLFHPDLKYARGAVGAEGPLRVLFLGRVLPYKGLDLLVEAIESLRAGGTAISLSVYGEGELGTLRPRLEALGADVVNRWLDDADIARALAHCDIVAAPCREASQSGVVAAALGAGVPVLVTPVGGLSEQFRPGVDGVVAAAVSPQALAAALAPLAADRAIVSALAANCVANAPARSMTAFLRRLVSVACSVDQ
jgi:glycosyltransferase involved in cell wall biosynthesis